MGKSLEEQRDMDSPLESDIEAARQADDAAGEGRDDRLMPAPAARSATRSGEGLRVYRPNQGRYVRLGTVIGGGVLALWGAAFIYEELGALISRQSLLAVRYSIPVVWLLVCGALIYWVTYMHRRAGDFFIATEGEMKKVSWSSQREVIRSTKVVVACVVLLGLFLFIWDVLFMLLFSSMNVLRTPVTLSRLLGGEE